MQGINGSQVTILNTNVKRETSKQARLANIQAASLVAGVVRTTLGPKSMLKMLLDPMGGIVLTNDGHAVLREIDVLHPAAKSLLDISRAQDEEVGDGTTSVVILAGELLSQSERFVNRSPIHPVTIFQGFMSALQDVIDIQDKAAVPLDVNDRARMQELVQMSLTTKFSSRYGDHIAAIALSAVETVKVICPVTGKPDIDTKRFAKVEKIAGGQFEDSRMVKGVLVNKDVTHAKMRRVIKNPRIVLLDSTLEYKKGESQTNVEISNEGDFEKLLAQEEAEIQRMCDCIASVRPDVVVTEKGVSDLAQHFLMRSNITVIRRVRKTDNNRIARVTGATVVNRLEELQEKHVGTKSCMFEVTKIGDEYYSSFLNEDDPKACTILLRGGSKDSLNEIERNLHDALGVARNLLIEPKLLPGGGAIEMKISTALADIAPSKGVLQPVYEAIATAFEVIPRTLIENAGGDVIRSITNLRGEHAQKGGTEIADSMAFGIDGNSGEIVDVKKTNIWDSYLVKSQMVKTAIECAATIIRIDDVLSGVSMPGDMQAKPEVVNPLQ